MSAPICFRIGALGLSFALSFSLRAAEQSAPVTESAAAPATGAHRTKVDINTADIPTLEAVPEIGTNFANAVVAARPFKSVDELDRILRIGPQKMDELKTKVTASPVKRAASTAPEPAPLNATKSSPVKEGTAIPRTEVTERYDRKTSEKQAKKP